MEFWDGSAAYVVTPLDNWSRLVRPHIMWMKTIHQDLKSWMKQSTWLRIINSGYWCLRLALHTASGACQKWRRRCYKNATKNTEM